MIVVDAAALLEFLLQTPLGTSRPLDSRVEAAGERHGDDAMYIALGEALEAPIVTCDTPLAKAPGHHNSQSATAPTDS